MDQIAASTILGLNSRRLRLARGWSAAHLAQKLGWSADAVLALEAGRLDVRLDELDGLSRVLSVALYDLLREQEENGGFGGARRSA